MRYLMKKSYEFLIQSKRENIDFINKIVEAYEGAGVVRTLDPIKGIIMEEKVENLESLLNYIIKELVETKDKVNVTYEVLDSNVTFKVSVAKGEMGKIIGKNGLTANAIRGVMQAAGVKDKLNVNVEFLD